MNFNKDELLNILNELNLEEDIELFDIPQLDLYMDQVIQLFENNLTSSKRNDTDKLLTKTMINNYSKDKLLIPVKNKRYTKNHVILMVLIYNLKQSLSIGDIKSLFNTLVINLQDDKSSKIDLPQLYNKFLQLKKYQNLHEEVYIDNMINKVEEAFEGEDNKEHEKSILAVLALINSANIQRRVAEKIIDKYFSINK